MRRKYAAWALVAFALAGAAPVTAETVAVKAAMSPKESMKMTFGDGSNRFVLMVRREGKAEGTGTLAGAAVTEYGWHDILPPIDGDPHGYLQFKAPNGDITKIKWTVRAVFLKDQ